MSGSSYHKRSTGNMNASGELAAGVAGLWYDRVEADCCQVAPGCWQKGRFHRVRGRGRGRGRAAVTGHGFLLKERQHVNPTAPMKNKP